jgi:hypothetical protein
MIVVCRICQKICKMICRICKKNMSKLCKPVSNMQNSDKSIFCSVGDIYASAAAFPT